MPVVPTVFGYDARLQFLHEDDGVEAIHHATVNDLPGTFNLAGDGVLSLSQAIRRLGRPTLRLPSFTASSTAAVVRRARLADFSPDQITFLTYGRACRHDPDADRVRLRTGVHDRGGVRRLPAIARAPARSRRPSQLLTAGLGALRG